MIDTDGDRIVALCKGLSEYPWGVKLIPHNGAERMVANLYTTYEQLQKKYQSEFEWGEKKLMLIHELEQALEAERAAHQATQAKLDDRYVRACEMQEAHEETKRQLVEAQREIACAESGPICCKSCNRSHHYECNVKVKEERDDALRRLAEAQAHLGRADTDCEKHGRYVATTCIGCLDDALREKAEAEAEAKRLLRYTEEEHAYRDAAEQRATEAEAKLAAMVEKHAAEAHIETLRKALLAFRGDGPCFCLFAPVFTGIAHSERCKQATAALATTPTSGLTQTIATLPHDGSYWHYKVCDGEANFINMDGLMEKVRAVVEAYRDKQDGPDGNAFRAARLRLDDALEALTALYAATPGLKP